MTRGKFHLLQAAQKGAVATEQLRGGGGVMQVSGLSDAIIAANARGIKVGGSDVDVGVCIEDWSNLVARPNLHACKAEVRSGTLRGIR